METKFEKILANLQFPLKGDFESGLQSDTENLEKYRLLDFVKAVLNEKTISADFLAQLIATYDPDTQEAKVRGRTININKGALARALKLPDTDVVYPPDEDDMPPVDPTDMDYACFLHGFVLTCLYLNAGTAVVPKVHEMRQCVFNGHPKHFDFHGFMWLLVEDELLQGIDIGSCYYARHLQCLIRSQHRDLFADGGGGGGGGQSDDGVPHNDDGGQTVDGVPQSDDNEFDSAAQSVPGESQGSREYGAPGLIVYQKLKSRKKDKERRT